MAITIKQTEATPESYPDLGSPSPLSEAAQALDPAFIWDRIESYVAFRWTERAVVWIVEGPGEWTPPLAPASISDIEVWRDGEWHEASDLQPSPYGGVTLTGSGPYRVTGTVGTDAETPEIVIEAFRRLAEYMAQRPTLAGVSRESKSIGGDLTVGYSRDPAWLAKALQNSGAADLLRSFRRC